MLLSGWEKQIFAAKYNVETGESRVLFSYSKFETIGTGLDFARFANSCNAVYD